ncbi:MAG: hypothetical protein KDN22_08160 [Verrucomicrobiae bacterium]|nr:hypothetical protein [Verrucomicrobiae bacterium]
MTTPVSISATHSLLLGQAAADCSVGGSLRLAAGALMSGVAVTSGWNSGSHFEKYFINSGDSLRCEQPVDLWMNKVTKSSEKTGRVRFM